MSQQTKRIRECAGMECAGVDAEAGIVRGVKLLGEVSKNGRRYLPESVSPSDYEQRPINLNHPDGVNKQRRVEDRFGWIEGAFKEGADWRGNLHFNPKHPFAPQFAWLVEHKPDLIGLSHDAVGKGRTDEKGTFVVEKVLEVKSVDLVADPASTKGLFESMENEEMHGEDQELTSLEDHIKNAVAAICGDSSLDLKEKVKKIRAALKLLEEPEEEEHEEESEDEGGEESEEKSEDEGGEEDEEKSEDEGGEEDEEKKAEESLKTRASSDPALKKLLERVDSLSAKLAAKERNELAARLIAEAKLPAAAVSDVFLSQLTEAKDEKAMQKLIEDRKSVLSIKRPTSTGPLGHGGSMDNKTFAKQLKGK